MRVRCAGRSAVGAARRGSRRGNPREREGAEKPDQRRRQRLRLELREGQPVGAPQSSEESRVCARLREAAHARVSPARQGTRGDAVEPRWRLPWRRTVPRGVARALAARRGRREARGAQCVHRELEGADLAELCDAMLAQCGGEGLAREVGAVDGEQHRTGDPLVAHERLEGREAHVAQPLADLVLVPLRGLTPSSPVWKRAHHPSNWLGTAPGHIS